MNELKLFDENGEVISLDDFITKLNSPEYLGQLSNEQIENLAFIVQKLKSPTKKIDDEIKERLKNGQDFEHISKSTTKRKSWKPDAQIKLSSLGQSAYQLKTPAQLEKLFKDDQDKLNIINDAATINVTDRIKFD